MTEYKPGKAARRETIASYIFLAPMLIGVTILLFIPVLMTIIMGFTDWNFVAGFDQLHFIGLDNFKALLEDDIFIKSMKNNLFLLLVVPVGMAVSLCLSIIINNHVYLKDTMKVIYFMPYISSVVAVAVVFQVLFHPTFGPVNQFLMSIGIDNPPKWLSDIHFALPSVMLIMIWTQIGFQLIIYLAGLQNIPRDLYEAADIDGAGGWAKFKKITFPMLSSTNFFLLIIGVIGTFKVFDLIAVLTAGGPSNSTSVTVYYLYETAFINLKSGYASAIALVLLLFVFVITLIQWYGQKKWVNE
ncbi:ABC transporter permease subunit [Paenibacillus sp. LMG 31461]|uniref:ABC transporter permease subunit n=1 Tax=Paenibacillus plantarum TaxID=2654975 RepID=A0ABX1XMM4_9BACL|nr:sugar ABC transporter permease [Paenibacillus plantarum]NOU69677.1 ABC transporter permease subunit [Paenibacillus plantarum]